MKTKVIFRSNQLSEAIKQEMWGIYHKAYHYDYHSFIKLITAKLPKYHKADRLGARFEESVLLDQG